MATLLRACAAGDRRAFAALYDATSAKLFAVALRILRDRAEAEDAVQEVYARLWRNAGRYDPARGRGMTWAVAVARNHAIDRLRARGPAADHDPAAVEALADPGLRAETRLAAMGEARRIAACLAALDPARAEALRGAYLEGLSYADLARRHGLPLNTLRTWLRRGLLALKECLAR